MRTMAPMGRRAMLMVATAALAGLLMAAVPAGAEEGDPPFVPWSVMLPSFTTGYEPSSANDCTSGRLRCVDAVIREMDRRFRPLATSCDHDAMFSLTYLRTTEEYRRAVDDGTFF